MPRWMSFCILLIAGNGAMAATLDDIAWMVGSWEGSLGSQRLQEAWSEPAGGHMSTMVRLTTNNETVMVELIAIREVDDSLVLYLRQFSPSLEPRLTQNMPMTNLKSGSVTFSAPESPSIVALTYRSIGPDSMEIDVTVTGGAVLTAVVKRTA